MGAQHVCLWCATLTESTDGSHPWCSKCLHRAGVPKESCDCLMCGLVLSLPNNEPEAAPLGSDLIDYGPDLLECDDMIDGFGPTSSAESGVEVIGRHFHQPEWTVVVLPGRVVIRCMDKDDPQTWVDVTISEDMVGKWFRLFCLDGDTG